MNIDYQSEPNLSVTEFIQVLQASGLGERRPIDDEPRIAAMLSGASVIITARKDDQLIGVSRAISDFAYCTYLSDLAVDQKFQRQGIGKELIRQTQNVCGENTRLILLAAPRAETYYPHIGMEQHHSCWMSCDQVSGTRQRLVDLMVARNIVSRWRKPNGTHFV